MQNVIIGFSQEALLENKKTTGVDLRMDDLSLMLWIEENRGVDLADMSKRSEAFEIRSRKIMAELPYLFECRSGAYRSIDRLISANFLVRLPGSARGSTSTYRFGDGYYKARVFVNNNDAEKQRVDNDRVAYAKRKEYCFRLIVDECSE